MLYYLVGLSQNPIQPLNRSTPDSTLFPFYHGVASGDPTFNSVIIWTRVSSNNSYEEVHWRVAKDTSFNEIIQAGTTTTDATKDYTVKVDVQNLMSNTYYYYEFNVGKNYSQRGRTHTLPSESDSIKNLKIAFFSCTNYAGAYYNAYDIVNNLNNVDLVIHLGDYIYEDGFNPNTFDTLNRYNFPRQAVYTLDGYRARYGHYRLDESLRDLHRQYPFMTIWDDHEFANDANADTAAKHFPYQGDYLVRKQAAIQAYMEWMPLRDDANRSNYINTNKAFGNLAEFYFIDNRTDRSRQDIRFLLRPFNTTALGTADIENIDDSDRTMLGKTQLNWLCDGLKNSNAKWKILSNQVVFSPFFIGQLLFPLSKIRHPESWDGYPLERRQLLDTIKSNNIENFVVVSGDIHNFMAYNIEMDRTTPYMNNNKTLGVEFVVDGLGDGDVFSVDPNWYYPNNPHCKFIGQNNKGYCILEINNDSVCCNYWNVDSSYNINNYPPRFLYRLCTKDKQSNLYPTQQVVDTVQLKSPLAPYYKRTNVPTKITTNKNEFSIYYTNGYLFMNINQTNLMPIDAVLSISDLSGKIYYQNHVSSANNKISLSTLPKGVYIGSLITKDKIASEKFLIK
ncbi:MAG: alkaline phosphatase D family protein [Chitinophagales bacterium]|nr:alkaline phosphatase D family protein [Chitinophagales bacterium]